jgi:flagellar hook-associated protein 2
MSSSAAPITSSSAPTSSSTPITFNGSSTYSSAFQQVITRAVNIASLPLQSLQTSVSNLTSQQAALGTIGTDFNALQSAIQALGSAVGGTPTAQVSDTSSVSATASAGALPGTYTIQVDDPGSPSTVLSLDTLPVVTDPSSQSISASSTYTLTLNGVTTTIDDSGSSLESLAESINAADAGVQATVVNIGAASSPNYVLAVTSNNLGTDTIQLNDGSNDLLGSVIGGEDAQYRLNGSGTGTDIYSTSSQVALSPGLTVNLLAESSSPVTITVSQDFSGVQTAISNVVSAYNTAFDAITQNRGQSGGALTGDPVVLTLQNVLQQLVQYTSGSGSVSSLADLGVTVGSTGELTFDASSMSTDNDAISQFLGGIDSGGFLQTANNDLTSVTDTTSGVIASDYNSIEATINTDNSQIADQQNQISNLQANLQAQLSQADAAIATLQAQDTYFQELFTAEYGSSGTLTSGG